MDVAALRRATDELGAYLSEMTAGDLGLPVTVDTTGDLGDLYLRIVHWNLTAAAELTGGRPAPSGMTRGTLAQNADLHGGGYDVVYRRTAGDLATALQAAGSSADLIRHVRAVTAATAEVRRALELRE